MKFANFSKYFAILGGKKKISLPEVLKNGFGKCIFRSFFFRHTGGEKRVESRTDNIKTDSYKTINLSFSLNNFLIVYSLDSF